MTVIDLNKATDQGKVHNLSGKARGQAARQTFGISELDESPLPVEVSVPGHIYAISSSYFLGLFSPSVVRAGSADAFLEKYRFDASPAIMAQVSHAISRCLLERE